MADKKISELTALTGALNPADALAIADDSASQTKKISPKTLIEEGVKIIADGSIPVEKIDTSLIDVEIPDNSITGAKLADNSSFIVSPDEPTAEFVGQGWLNSNTGKTYIWNGTEWVEHKAAGSVNEILSDTTGLIFVAATQTDDSVQLEAEHAPTTGPREFLAGPTATAGDVTQRQIIGQDLPDATETEKGAVSVPADSGLAVNSGAISIDNAVIPNSADTLHIVQYDEHGLVIAGREIEGGDLPVADGTTPGAVRPGTGLEMGGDGALNHSNNVTPNTGIKVEYDAQGHITGTLPLTSQDLDGIDIPAENITGEIGTDQLAECSVTGPKICDYATCLMQEDNPGAGDFLGQFWYTPSTAQLRVYARGSGPENIWLPVGFGALQANNLRWLGTYDADTDSIVSLTSVGTSYGLTAGQAFPPPSTELSGGYFLCQVAGANCSQPNLNGIGHDAGDWALCLDENQWIHIDAAAPGGGGGGGGAQYLNDLLDVNIGGAGGPFSTAPAMALSDKHIFKYDGGDGKWKNTDLLDGGTF